MVDRSNIPKQVPRLDLKDCPNMNTLRLVSEKIKEAIRDSGGKTIKTGGLLLTFEQKDGTQITNKYSAAFGNLLDEALGKLHLMGTEALAEGWYAYELQTPKLRSGLTGYASTDLYHSWMTSCSLTITPTHDVMDMDQWRRTYLLSLSRNTYHRQKSKTYPYLPQCPGVKPQFFNGKP